MDREREKTKSELLNELESIQGLLNDDEIPLLNQVIDKLDRSDPDQSAAHALREHFSEEDLQTLQSAYDALNGQIAKNMDNAADPIQPPDDPDTNQSAEQNYELDLGALPDQTRPIPATAVHAPEPPTEKLPVDVPLPGQRALFQAPGSDTEATRGTSEAGERKSPEGDRVTENPFLPQHIRERLRGNRAGDFPTTATTHEYSRQKLVDELIDSVMGQLETNLRLKLAVMSDEQLRKLLSDKT